jgi:hypothetical protein
MSINPASVGFCPRERMAAPNSFVVMAPGGQKRQAWPSTPRCTNYIGAPEQQQMWTIQEVIIVARSEVSWPSNLEMGWGIWLGYDQIWFWGRQKTTVIGEQAGGWCRRGDAPCMWGRINNSRREPLLCLRQRQARILAYSTTVRYALVRTLEDCVPSLTTQQYP